MAFVTEYESLYGETPNQFAADGYDCIYALKLALETAGCTPDMTAEAINDADRGVPHHHPDRPHRDGEGITWDSTGAVSKAPKGMVIEKGADGKIHVLTVSEVEEADAGKQAVLTVAGTDEDSRDSVTWTLIFDRSGGAATMSSDDFKVSKKYSEDVAEGSVSVSGMDEAYIGLVGGDAEPLRKALAAYMAKNVPQASSASFDGEASVDFNAKTVSASFHADDPARTVLVVAYADGKFTVSG